MYRGGSVFSDISSLHCAERNSSEVGCAPDSRLDHHYHPTRRGHSVYHRPRDRSCKCLPSILILYIFI